MNRILNNQTSSSKFYIPLTFIALICTLMLNFYIKISDCSLVFTFLAISLNVIGELYGNDKAMRSLVLSIFVSLASQWNLKYYIHGELINGLVIASFISVLVSAFIGLNVLSKLRFKYNFYVRSLLSLITYAIVDGAVMGVFFANKYYINKVVHIFAQEVAYKSFYGFIACASMLMISYLQKQFKIVKV